MGRGRPFTPRQRRSTMPEGLPALSLAAPALAVRRSRQFVPARTELPITAADLITATSGRFFFPTRALVGHPLSQRSVCLPSVAGGREHEHIWSIVCNGVQRK